jgi:hypothetical protein
VKVNGREIPSAQRGAAIDQNASTAEVHLNLASATFSPTGNNVIEAFAENGDGSLRTRGVIARWIHEKPRHEQPPRLFDVVVGVSKYDESLNLRYAVNDPKILAMP